MNCVTAAPTYQFSVEGYLKLGEAGIFHEDARDGIVEYWLLDLTRNELHVFRDPAGPAYRTTQVVRRGESIAPLAFADTPIALGELLPP